MARFGVLLFERIHLGKHGLHEMRREIAFEPGAPREKT
jgi:hypothetical protein